MIEGNVLKFGYGDISVSSDGLTQIINFQQFKPPGKCGDDVSNDVEYIGDKITLKISYKEYCEFYNNLQRILSKEISSFNFKEYVFNFTNFNEKSVEACQRNLNNAMYIYLLCAAA